MYLSMIIFKGWFFYLFLCLFKFTLNVLPCCCKIEQLLWILTDILEGEIDDVLCIFCWQVPVAHCFGPPGHYKKKFCTVCRKSLESPAFRCEGNLNPACTALCVSPSSLQFPYTAYLECLRHFWFVCYPFTGHGKVYFKLRNNKPATLDKLRTPCLRWAKNEELLWWKKDLSCCGS